MIVESLVITVLASSYCDARISNGSRMNCNALTAASRDLKPGTCISVNSNRSNKDVTIKINDLGPCSTKHCQQTTPHIFKRKLDLSYGAARAIGFNGLGKLKYKIVECH